MTTLQDRLTFLETVRGLCDHNGDISPLLRQASKLEKALNIENSIFPSSTNEVDAYYLEQRTPNIVDNFSKFCTETMTDPRTYPRVDGSHYFKFNNRQKIFTEFILGLNNGSCGVVEAGRQFGGTTLIALFALFWAKENPGCYIVILDNNNKNVYNFLASHIRMEYLAKSKSSEVGHILRFMNGSIIHCARFIDNFVANKPIDWLLIDNASHIPFSYNDAVQHLTNIASRSVLLNTGLHTRTGVFADLWYDGDVQRLSLPWYLDGDSAVLKTTRKALGRDQFAMEYSCENRTL